MANLALSVDETTVRDARKAAESMGISLNEAVRRFLADLAGGVSAEQDIADLYELSRNSGGRMAGWRFDRDEIHERS